MREQIVAQYPRRRADHFAQTPHGRPPLITLLSGGECASVLELPVADA